MQIRGKLLEECRMPSGCGTLACRFDIHQLNTGVAGDGAHMGASPAEVSSSTGWMPSMQKEKSGHHQGVAPLTIAPLP